jgi:hypothetical protein
MCLAEVRSFFFSDTIPHYNSQVGEESPEMEMPIESLTPPADSTDGNAHKESEHVLRVENPKVMDPEHPSSILVEFSTPTSSGFDIFKALPIPNVKPAMRTEMFGSFNRSVIQPIVRPTTPVVYMGAKFYQGL